MNTLYFEEQSFEQKDFTVKPLAKGEYENCVFTGCNFSNTNLSGIHFSECEFTGCNLGMALLGGTAFKDVRFKDCKLLGLHFEHCSDSLFSVAFNGCILNLASFYKRKLKKTVFKNCSLQEADFTEADVSGAVFDNCDLAKAVFDNTLLEKADFRTAYHYSINPEKNRLKKAKFSAAGIAGLLDQYDIDIHP
jgi:fluoroquinolone resistance protein